MGVRSTTRRRLRRKTRNDRASANAAAEEEIDALSPLLRLPSHLLDSILARLDLRSHLRLGVACSFLHRHAIIQNPPLSKCPSFIPRFNRDARLFYAFLRPLHIFDADPRVPISESVKCVGSFHGWLAIVRVVEGEREGSPSFHGDVHIFHRLSHWQMTLPRYDDWTSVEKVLFNMDSTGDICFVTAVYDGSQVAVCVPLRGLPWRMVFVPEDEQGLNLYVSDLAFHKTFLLWVLSFDANYHVIASCFSFRPELINKPPLTLDVPNSASRQHSFLIHCCGKLLAVVPDEESRDANVPRGFRVWECEETGLIKRSRLDGRALLLRVGIVGELSWDMAQGVAVPAEQMGLMEADCLYFLSDADTYMGFKYVYDPDKGKFVCEEKPMLLSKR